MSNLKEKSTITYIIDYIKNSFNYINDYIKTNFIKKINYNITYYISPDGDDSTGNGSNSKPFFTINRAIEYFYNNYQHLGNYCSLIILCEPGIYIYNSTQYLKTPYNFHYQSGDVIIRIQPTKSFTSSSSELNPQYNDYNYNNYTDRSLSEIKEDITLQPTVTFKFISDAQHFFQTGFVVVTRVIMQGIKIEGPSGCRLNVMDSNPIYFQGMNCYDEGMIQLYNCIFEGFSIAFLASHLTQTCLFYRNLRIINCYQCFSVNDATIQIQCDNIEINGFNQLFLGTNTGNANNINITPVTKTEIINEVSTTIYNPIHFQCNNWHYGYIVGKYANISLSNTNGYNRWTTPEPEITKFFEINPSINHINDSNNYSSNPYKNNISVICYSYPDDSSNSIGSWNEKTNFIIASGWQIKYYNIDITKYLRYQVYPILYHYNTPRAYIGFDNGPVKYYPENISKIVLGSLPCDIVLFNTDLVDYSKYSISQYWDYPNSTNYPLVVYKYSNITTTRLYQYGVCNIKKNSNNFDFSTNKYKNSNYFINTINFPMAYFSLNSTNNIQYVKPYPIIEGYFDNVNKKFYSDQEKTQEITPEYKKIYKDITNSNNPIYYRCDDGENFYSVVSPYSTDEISVVITPIGTGTKVEIIEICVDKFWFSTTGPFSWMAVNVNGTPGALPPNL